MPSTTYPEKLAYTSLELEIKKSDRLLDIGCGRGEFLKGFIACGVSGYAVDQSSVVQKYCPEAGEADIENGVFHTDNFFDAVYSKR